MLKTNLKFNAIPTFNQFFSRQVCLIYKPEFFWDWKLIRMPQWHWPSRVVRLLTFTLDFSHGTDTTFPQILKTSQTMRQYGFVWSAFVFSGNGTQEQMLRTRKQRLSASFYKRIKINEYSQYLKMMIFVENKITQNLLCWPHIFHEIDKWRIHME